MGNVVYVDFDKRFEDVERLTSSVAFDQEFDNVNEYALSLSVETLNALDIAAEEFNQQISRDS